MASERVEALHDELVAAVEQLVTGEQWQRALDVASQFHNYSWNNLLLIQTQAIDRGFLPTRVAGFTQWKKLGRNVRRGEKGLKILAPVTYRRQDADVEDPTGSTPRVLVGFRVAHVFDISQTDGEPLPTIDTATVAGDAPDRLWDAAVAQITAAGFTVHRDSWPDPNLNGYTSWADRRVAVRDDLPAAHATKTALHELAHVQLHEASTECRGVKEVEAESVAYIVARAVGLKTGTYSFPYVATWAGGDVEVVRATGTRVTQCAHSILDKLAESPAHAEVA